MKIEPLDEYLQRMSREYVASAIQECGGDRGKAAMALKISMATLYRKLAQDGTLEKLKTKDRQRVYLIKNTKATAYKIGISVSPIARENTLGSYEPNLVLVVSWPGTRIDEKLLHRKFAHKRIRGEWFALDADDIAAIHAYFGPEVHQYEGVSLDVADY